MAQQLSNQRIAWFNGNFMPEGQVMIPFRDRSWKYGDGAFDMTRTFEGAPFRRIAQEAGEQRPAIAFDARDRELYGKLRPVRTEAARLELPLGQRSGS